MDVTTTAASSDAAIIGILALLGMSIAMLAVIAIVFYVFYVIAFWKIFSKAGEKGWKSLIPFYNAYVQFKITWKTSMFWIALAFAVVAGILSGIDGGSTVSAIAGICGLVAGIIELMSLYYLSKSFGHGAGYFIGLIFFPWIFTLILGFGSSKYVGPANK